MGVENTGKAKMAKGTKLDQNFIASPVEYKDLVQ
jgi:hypothetical protein